MASTLLLPMPLLIYLFRLGNVLRSWYDSFLKISVIQIRSKSELLWCFKFDQNGQLGISNMGPMSHKILHKYATQK